ncbi:hypothetical protein MIZ01_1417 [Sideroxyarcus emersonii]|uniref:Uncharacterized protein n=1 Tax=Sideroxyarcus emersonii TaxID=2764705 RepID=A0AAN1X9Z6_9PROT|nr:hypothetical protein [Sideroxyarcus emersonii]BCK87626.1 hypothetical protein MIZ01_1417 [Sideroxyarcus emersonii]
MGENEVQREMDQLSALIDKLEAKAAIGQAVRQARETGSPAKLRDAYYSVADPELRNKLISTTGRLDQLYLIKCEQDVSLAKEGVSKAEAKAGQHPWPLLAAAYIGPVVIGQWGLGLFGAIGGAVLGYFLGQWVFDMTKKENAREIDEAKHLLASALRCSEAAKVDPYLFSAAEQQGGQREN